MAGQANEEERLPWLEPYREPGARKAPPVLKAVPRAPPSKPSVPSGRGGVPLAGWLGTGLVVVAMAVGAGFWAGRSSAPQQVEPASAPTVTIPVAKVDPIPMPEVIEPTAADEQAAPASTPTQHTAAAPRKARASAARSHAVARTAHRSVRRSTKPIAATPPPPPTSAPPLPRSMARITPRQAVASTRGRVLDLGYFPSLQQADEVYREVLQRYPTFAQLSKVVVARSLEPNQPRLYGLQLGARSPADARRLCVTVRALGRPCTVR